MITQPPQRLLRTPDAALLLGLSARTLEKHRCSGTGPTYRKLGGRVVYAVADLISWADRGIRRSTSDTTASVISPPHRIDPKVLDRKGVVRR
ncbi:helix-turn-helix transcriptional regulator [Sphingomonas sp. PB4P5]|uniref:helix-turn-helix transcriptional regulator n=1 Tax=Parasphingomonas puruogangriensis TaxID=3096155 RepID=UPI002FC59ACF